jgi:hypothetical protein
VAMLPDDGLDANYDIYTVRDLLPALPSTVFDSRDLFLLSSPVRHI